MTNVPRSPIGIQLGFCVFWIERQTTKLYAFPEWMPWEVAAAGMASLTPKELETVEKMMAGVTATKAGTCHRRHALKKLGVDRYSLHRIYCPAIIAERRSLVTLKRSKK